ncbi:MAG: divalent-cation tolerance protein CutA [Candidatus Kerfeldbacteria bacterium CG_4_10_14_0_8_um_filter_42_10]|uniref:Divalent-cation tolerance protein CutA n=1 Tax=Candidatus Kerfeldbacteria bacterium CG_4_10_14_0_8_um_filter_42_10 TaxID=2014248 RepID=A0A2M7RGP0_9BACT|nr:MAG: divalent-cation tolerance protein CutA [Candidatus Kerfeldbacteria bacterium CG_4_10_14_0_8_um_filter_42_10]
MIFVYIACSTRQEAKKIGMACVKKHLAACANYSPMESIYWWQKKLVLDKEYALILKTRKENFPKVKSLVKKMHSYEVPCICSWRINQVEKNYLEWLKENSK